MNFYIVNASFNWKCKSINSFKELLKFEAAEWLICVNIQMWFSAQVMNSWVVRWSPTSDSMLSRESA